MTAPAHEILAAVHALGLVTAPIYLYKLHPKQRAFVLDPRKRKAAHPGRRSGKTRALAVALVHAVLSKPEVMACFISLTRRHAKRLIWNPLKRLNRECALGLTFDESELVAKAANGSEIYLFGAETEDDLEKVRGNSYILVAIDEAGSFRGARLKYLIDEAIEPALMDLRGSLILCGTPNPSCHGYFADVCTGQNPKVRRWEAVFHWTMLDNPYVPDPGTWLREQVLEVRGWTMDHPVVQREYGGLWRRDEQSLVYHYSPAVNDCAEVPAGRRTPHYVLGVDLGASKELKTTALSLWCFFPDDTHVYCVKSWLMHEDPGPSDICEEIERVNKDYPLEAVVVDPGGLGGGYVKEFRRRYLPVRPADKAGKAAYIEMMNDDFKRGLVRVVRSASQDYVEELQNLQWDPESDPPKEDKRRPNHLCDAGLYAWRHCRHFRAAEDKPKAPPTVDEIAKRETERLRAQAEAAVRRMRQQATR